MTLYKPFFMVFHAILSFYLAICILRFYLQVVRADFYNPLSQFIVKMTNPPLVKLRRFIPGWRGYDMASVVLIFSVQLIEVLVIMLIKGVPASPVTVLVAMIYNVGSLFLWVILMAMIVLVIVSWTVPYAQTPALSLIHSVTEPLLRIPRRYIKPIQGFDFSIFALSLGIFFVIQMVDYICRAILPDPYWYLYITEPLRFV
mgnify:CR=1 FL=1